MKKIILFGMNNESFGNSFRNEFKFKKQQSFVECFEQLLKNLNWDKWEIDSIMHDIGDNIKSKIYNYKDEIKFYKNKNYDMEVFYGDKHIFLIVRGNKKKRQKIIDKIFKVSKWVKPKKMKIKKFKKSR